MKYIEIYCYLMVTWSQSMIRVYSLSMLVMMTFICGFMLMILIYVRLINNLLMSYLNRLGQASRLRPRMW